MILEASDINRILPHRPPLLLVDRAVVNPDNTVKAEVYLRPEWEIFQGHFPSYPVLPGIYVTESMAQAAGLLLLTMPGNEGKLPLFLNISQMRFLRPARPGDTMQLSAELVQDAGNGIYECKVFAHIDNKKIAAGRISLALR